MKNVVIIPNPNKDVDFSVTKRLAAVLMRSGLSVYLERATGISIDGVILYSDFPSCAELIIIVGGDGSVIDASRIAISHDLPLVGVNMGKVGYLSEVDPDNLSLFESLVTGDYTVQQKMLLSVSVCGKEVDALYAMNDVIVSRGGNLGIGCFKLCDSCGNSIGYRADGVIIATPQGSTAYSFSAGGPVLAHDAEGILVTPVCPHTIFNRSVLFSSGEQITVTNTGEYSLSITVDGRKLCEIAPKEYCCVKRADHTLSMLSFSSNSMFKELFRKMSIMEDLKQ